MTQTVRREGNKLQEGNQSRTFYLKQVKTSLDRTLKKNRFIELKGYFYDLGSLYFVIKELTIINGVVKSFFVCIHHVHSLI